MRDPLLSLLGATLRPCSNKVGLSLGVSGLSTMLGQHVLGAEGTDIYYPRSQLLVCSLLGYCELCIGDAVFSWEVRGQISELWQCCSAMGLIWARVRGPALSRKRPLEFWDKSRSKASKV